MAIIKMPPELDWTLYCDECEYLETNLFDSFEEARKFAKEYGWKVRYDEHGDIENICPNCEVM